MAGEIMESADMYRAQRDLLAMAIAAAAIKAGIIGEETALTGAHLAMLCENLADMALRAAVDDHGCASNPVASQNTANVSDKLEMPTPDEIQALLKKHGISQQQAAGLTHASYRTWRNWCAPVGSNTHRDMPIGAWELLLIKLGEMKS